MVILSSIGSGHLCDLQHGLDLVKLCLDGFGWVRLDCMTATDGTVINGNLISGWLVQLAEILWCST